MARADVHLARIDEAPELARIQYVTWRTAYADTIGEQAVEELATEDTKRRWADAIEHPDTDVFVATEGNSTVGFAVGGPAPEDEGPENAALIATILVEPRWSRRGHGGRLLAAAARALRSRGADNAVTWVLESDAATLNFYRSAGWNPDGTVRTLDTGEKTIRELRLAGGLDLTVG